MLLRHYAEAKSTAHPTAQDRSYVYLDELIGPVLLVQ